MYVMDTIPCPLDTNQIIITPKGWEVYQTQNDEWNGPRLNRCINFFESTGSAYQHLIFINEIDTNHTLFVRMHLSDSTKIPIQHNTLFQLTGNIYGFGLEVETGNTCSGGFCSGLNVGIEIPDSTGSATDMRWYQGTFENYWGSNTGLCFPSEKFVNGNFIREIFFQFKVQQIPLPLNAYLSFNSGVWEEWVWSQQVTYINTYNIGPRRWSSGFYDNSIVLYPDSTYPSPAHVGYINVTPTPNTATADTIDVLVTSQAHFSFQPYTQLRAGTNISGTQNHILYFTNEGGEICFSFFEFQSHGGGGYFHKAGDLHMSGPMSCMMFSNGSTFLLGQGETLHYGREGEGFLVLLTGAKFIIEKDAELIIYNNLAIGQVKDDETIGNVYMDLNKGSTLRFAPGSKLNNTMFSAGNPKLYIKMRGGILDDSGLSASDKLNIVRVYDEPNNNGNENLALLGNPVSNTLAYSWISNGSNVIIQVMDATGKILFSEQKEMAKGMNFEEIKTNSFEPGIYFLKVTEGEFSGTQRLLKL